MYHSIIVLPPEVPQHPEHIYIYIYMFRYLHMFLQHIIHNSQITETLSTSVCYGLIIQKDILMSQNTVSTLKLFIYEVIERVQTNVQCWDNKTVIMSVIRKWSESWKSVCCPLFYLYVSSSKSSLRSQLIASFYNQLALKLIHSSPPHTFHLWVRVLEVQRCYAF